MAPIDASIPLQSQMPNLLSPLQAQQQVGQIRAQQQQQAMGQQQMQLNDAALQQHQQQLAEGQRQLAVRKVTADLAGKYLATDPLTGVTKFDTAGFGREMIGRGMGDALPEAMKFIAPLNAEFDSHAKAKYALISAGIHTIEQTDHDPNIAQTVIKGLADAGALDPSLVDTVNHAIASSPTPDMIASIINQVKPMVPGYQEYADSRNKSEADVKKTAAETRKAEAEATNFEKYGSGTPPSLESKSVMVAGKPTLVTFNPRTGETRDVNGNVVTNAVPMPPASVQVQNITGGKSSQGDWAKSGAEFLATIPPEWRNTVKKVGDYDTPIEKITSVRGTGNSSPSERAMVARWAMQYNPTWQEDLASSRGAVRRDYMSPKGTAGQNIIALNTAISHMGTSVELAQAVNNGDTQAINRIVNYVKTQLGHPEVTNYQTAITALAGEEAKTFKSSGATDQEIAKWDATMPTSASPGQISGNAQTAASLLAGRFHALNDQYVQVMGRKDFNFLNSTARTVLTKLGVDVGGWEPEGAPNIYDRIGQPETTPSQQTSGGTSFSANYGGKTYSFKSQALLDQWKKGMGIK